MRILLVVPRFHTNQYQLVKTLLENRHLVHLHVASLGSTEDYSLLKPLKFDQCRFSYFLERVFGQGGVNRPNYFPDPLEYWRTIKTIKPEIVIIRDPFKLFSLLAAFCCLVVKAKVIFYSQEDLYRSRGTKTKFKQRLLLNWFKAAWMTPTKTNVREPANRLKHMYYVPLPIPVRSESQQAASLLCDEPKVLMIGKYHQERKNHLLLLEAVHFLKKRYKFKVTIVGECVRKQQVQKLNFIKEEIIRMGLSEIVELKQNVPFGEMRDLYAAHHLFVLPAVDEQYGISVAEALGYGLPSICTDTNGSKCNVINGENGFVVKSNSLQELIAALEELISDQTKRQFMSMNSLLYSQHHLSGDAFYKSFQGLLNDRFQLQL